MLTGKHNFIEGGGGGGHRFATDISLKFKMSYLDKMSIWTNGFQLLIPLAMLFLKKYKKFEFKNF